MLGLLPMRCDCERADYRKEEDTLTDPVRCPKKFPLRDSNVRPSRLRSITLTITLQELCLQGILLSDSLSLLWLQRAGFSVGCSCRKTIFRALKKCVFFFFRTALMTLRDARLSKKNNFSGSHCLFRAIL